MTLEQIGLAGQATTRKVPPIVEAGRAAARLTKALELAVGECSLSLPQYRLLAFLSGGPERATELAQWLEVSPPSLTALVDGLVHKGFVQRVASEEDRRCVRHLLTDTGSAALIAGDTAIATRLEQVAAFLTAEEAERAIVGLSLLGIAITRARAQKQAGDETTADKTKEVAATR